MAHVHTGDKQGATPNVANAWGAIYRNGYVYVPDMNSGLWVIRVEGKSELDAVGGSAARRHDGSAVTLPSCRPAVLPSCRPAVLPSCRPAM